MFHRICIGVYVSIHSLTQRETWPRIEGVLCVGGFNPLPHAEGDPVLAVNFIVRWVSIHSLTQRETGICQALFFMKMFQSTPSRRGRRRSASPMMHRISFNPLPHAEGDAICPAHAQNSSGFNPLPHAEGDKGGGYATYHMVEFQSTPSRRGRRPEYGISEMQIKFQSTPSRRGRQWQL